MLSNTLTRFVHEVIMPCHNRLPREHPQVCVHVTLGGRLSSGTCHSCQPMSVLIWSFLTLEDEEAEISESARENIYN